MVKASAVALVVVLAVTLQASTIRVPSDQSNIQLAVDAAAEGDTVMLEASGSPFIGAGNRDISLNGKAVVINTQGTVDGNHRALTLSNIPKSSMRVEGITFTGGWFGSSEGGGAVLIDKSHAVLSDCIFKSNSSGAGGG